jgi:hypothetical protein
MIVGALISYMWVMSNYYYEPQSPDLIITDVNFAAEHAGYFNLTIMNPSHSPSAANISAIYFTVEGDTSIYNVTSTYPEQLPVVVERATSETIKCLSNWGEFAGKSITVYAVATNTAGSSRTVKTPFTKIELEANLDPSIASRRFNITVMNDAASVTNLTLIRVSVDQYSVDNLTVALPLNVAVNDTVPIQCYYSLEVLVDPVIRVDTAEGYYAEVQTNLTARVPLYITQVAFNETNTEEMKVTMFSSAASSTSVNITSIGVTYDNTTTYLNGSLTNPPFVPDYVLDPNETVTFTHCLWNWTTIRDKEITVTISNRQEFTPVSSTVKTPQSVVFRISGLDFNLTDTGKFTINVTNVHISTEEINITQVKLNETSVASFESQTVGIGVEKQLNCTFDWTSLKGTNVNFTVITADGLNASEVISLPSIDLRMPDILICDRTTSGIPYVNVTMSNTAFSARNANITNIVFSVGNVTSTVDGTLTNPLLAPNGYLLTIGTSTAITCPWNWTVYPNQNVTVSVETADGLTVSETYGIPT